MSRWGPLHPSRDSVVNSLSQAVGRSFFPHKYSENWVRRVAVNWWLTCEPCDTKIFEVVVH